MRLVRGLSITTALALAAAAHDVARAGDAPRAVDVIENDLVADDPAVRAKAAAELTDRFPDGAVAVPMLVDLLDDESPEVVAAAAKAIDSMAVAGAAQLAAHYADRDAQNWGSVFIGSVTFERWSKNDVAESAETLSNSQRESLTPWLLRIAGRANATSRLSAAAALAVHGVERLIERDIAPAEVAGRTAAVSASLALLNADAGRSSVGASLLAWLRPSDKATIVALTERLAHDGESRQVCDALSAIGPRAASAAPALLKAIDRPDSTSDCARALIRIGRQADVIDLFAQGDGRMKSTLAADLAALRRGASVVVPYLIGELQDAKARARHRLETAATLACYGDDAVAALPALKRLAAEVKKRESRLNCADAILAISPTDVDGLTIVDDASAHPVATKDGGGIDDGTMILAERAGPSPSIVDRLRTVVAAFDWTKSKALGDDADSMNQIVDGLGRFGPAAKSAAPELTHLLGALFKGCIDVETMSSCCPLRTRTARALGRIGPDAAAAIPELEALTKSHDETICVPAAQALRRIRVTK